MYKAQWKGGFMPHPLGGLRLPRLLGISGPETTHLLISPSCFVTENPPTLGFMKFQITENLWLPFDCLSHPLNQQHLPPHRPHSWYMDRCSQTPTLKIVVFIQSYFILWNAFDHILQLNSCHCLCLNLVTGLSFNSYSLPWQFGSKTLPYYI